MNLEYWNNYWKCLHLLSVLYPLNIGLYLSRTNLIGIKNNKIFFKIFIDNLLYIRVMLIQ